MKKEILTKIINLRIIAKNKDFLETVKIGAYNKALLDVINELKND